MLAEINWEPLVHPQSEGNHFMSPECSSTFIDHLQEIGVTILLSAVGASVLHLIYQSIKTRWPEAYTSISTDFDQQVRTNPFRSMVLFRGGPVFLIALFATVLVERYGGYPWASAILLIVIYLTFTTFKAIWETTSRPRPPHWAVLVCYHLASAVVVGLLVLAATALRTPLESFIPPTKDLLIAVWAGLFAMVFAAGARTILSPTKLSEGEILEQLKKDIGDENWKHIAKVAKDNKELRELLSAIILAEAQQRPRWFRRLERIKGIFSSPGTYGVAQVASPQPIEDRESIELLAEKFANYSVPQTYGYPDYQQLRRDLLAHNPDGPHAGRIIEFHKLLNEKH